MNYERILRRIRNSPKLWEHDSAKIDRVLLKVKAKAIAQQRQKLAEPVGPYSGLTRRELAQSRTCETDWF